DDDFGQIEGLGVYGRTSGSDFGNDVFLAVGPGPFTQCDGAVVCSAVFSAEDLFTPVAAVSFSVEDPEGPARGSEVTLLNEVPLIEPPQTQLPEELALATNTNAITVLGDDLGSPSGLFESTPVLPSEIDDDGGFVFVLDDIRNLPGRIFFIDPEIATGYTYEITGDLFFSVQAPSLGAVADGDGEYLLSYGMGLTRTLQAGELFEFGPAGVSSFTITGIDPALMLDPTNANAFVTGVSVVSGGIPGTITQTAIRTDVSAVPIPASGLMILSGFAGMAVLRRRRRAPNA
ncbi:MAG: VPLPA-CTERM sorting domain-containing protein, partial [Pseudomonadota bacterium]